MEKKNENATVYIGATAVVAATVVELLALLGAAANPIAFAMMRNVFTGISIMVIVAAAALLVWAVMMSRSEISRQAKDGQAKTDRA